MGDVLMLRNMTWLQQFSWMTGCFIAAGLSLILIILYVVIPQPVTMTDNAGTYRLRFWVEDSVLFKPGECVVVRWEAEGIQAIFIDGEGKIGSDSQTTCPENIYTPRAQVIRQDGTESTYEISLHYVLLNRLVWLLFLLVTMLVLAALYRVISPRIIRWLKPLQKPLVFSIKATALVAASLLVLEISLRLFLAQYGTPADMRRYVRTADDIQGEAESRNLVQPVPFIIYLPNPAELNEWGYRSDNFAIPKPDGIFRIAALGGSTTYGTGTRRDESYPAYLQKILRDEYGYSHVEVINAGVPSWNSWHSLTNLAFRVLETQPDMLIYFEAINDTLVRGAPPECYQGMNAYRGLPPNAGEYRQAALNLAPSAVYRLIGIAEGWLRDPLGQASGIELQFVQPLCNFTNFIPTLDTLDANPPLYYERNLRSMVGIAQAHDIEVMLATWTYYQLKDWEAAGIAQHNTLVKNLGTELDLPVYDLAADYPENPALWVEGDWQHMNEAGSRIQAELFAQFIATQGLIPPEK
jgi:lysophospholipase L1-like esterase